MQTPYLLTQKQTKEHTPSSELLGTLVCIYIQRRVVIVSLFLKPLNFFLFNDMACCDRFGYLLANITSLRDLHFECLSHLH